MRAARACVERGLPTEDTDFEKNLALIVESDWKAGVCLDRWIELKSQAMMARVLLQSQY